MNSIDWRERYPTEPARDYMHERPNSSCAYIAPAVARILRQRPATDVFDLGCGTGDVAAYLAERGFDVTGVDPSRDGIRKARAKYPHLNLGLGSSQDSLAVGYGLFSSVVSLEVIEHVYDPISFAESLYSLVAPGGVAIVSTPYHGYLKNLLIALAGKTDQHYMPLKVHGHIKFWSLATLRQLLLDAGFSSVEFKLVGRVSPIAKSMIAIARKT